MLRRYLMDVVCELVSNYGCSSLLVEKMKLSPSSTSHIWDSQSMQVIIEWVSANSSIPN